MQRYSANPGAPWLVLAHGAGAGERHPWMIHVAQELAVRGVSVITFEFPYMAAGRKRPDPGPALEDAFAAAWTDVHAGLAGATMFAGGKSMGGRIASQLAARGGLAPPPAGLVFFGYPLHPPGAPARRRDQHLPKVAAPMLFLHGTRDPFGDPDEMQTLTAALPGARLELVDGGDHSLQTSRRAGAQPRALDRAIDVAARWIQTLADRQSGGSCTDMIRE